MTGERLLTGLQRVGMVRNPDHYRLRPSGPGRVLDVGCGHAKYPGATGIDISADTHADLVIDLNEMPYPIDDDSFDQILCQDVLEHVRQPVKVMAELHRIGRPGGRLQVRTPHYSSVLAYGDPTHEHYFSVMAVRSFAQPLFSHYGGGQYRLVHVTLDFWDPLRWVGVGWLANRFQSVYEMLFAFVLPAMNIRAEFEIVK